MQSIMSTDALVLVNLLANLAIFWVAICRSAAIQDYRVVFSVRVQYILLAPGSVANGLQTMLFKETPSVGSVIFTVIVLLMLVLDSRQWRRGVPHSAIKPHLKDEL